jgi:hypothetical protein
MLVPLIHARSIIPKSNKYIWFRQHHILMYVRKSSKKRKYLIVKLLGMRSSDRSLYVFRCRWSGCINRWDVLINYLEVPWGCGTLQPRPNHGSQPTWHTSMAPRVWPRSGRGA